MCQQQRQRQQVNGIGLGVGRRAVDSGCGCSCAVLELRANRTKIRKYRHMDMPKSAVIQDDAENELARSWRSQLLGIWCFFLRALKGVAAFEYTFVYVNVCVCVSVDVGITLYSQRIDKMWTWQLADFHRRGCGCGCGCGCGKDILMGYILVVFDTKRKSFWHFIYKTHLSPTEIGREHNNKATQEEANKRQQARNDRLKEFAKRLSLDYKDNSNSNSHNSTPQDLPKHIWQSL